jgi:hypothetical protein
MAVLALYVVTGIGGSLCHSRDLEASAWENYRELERRNAAALAAARAEGDEPFLMELYEGGPVTGVNWCVPVLPGILLVDSYSACGPMGGRGTAKVVAYYGTGSMIVCELWGWMS